MGIDFHSHYMQIIRANLNKYPEKKLIIFPFGEQGMIFKNILNSAYDLHENYIIDNVLCNYNKNIFPLYSLENMDDKSLLFFLVATDKELNNKLYNQIKIKFPNAEIINVLEPLIIPVNDKEGWFKEFKELLGIKRLISNKQYVRIGRMNDGGYVMLDDIETNMKKRGSDFNVITVGNLHVKRDFSDVRDIARGYRLVLERGTPNQVYNIGSGKVYELKELLNYIISLSDMPIEVRIDNHLIRPNEPASIWCDNHRIKKELGWCEKHSIFDAMHDMYEHYLNEL